ncbi:MAG: cation:proton antiporter [Deltaproteobacteria bacterium]|jgi:Kef-type K+ transport system membrane component KefB|nr:cation:proton antiporter [Deltaproteobacteria bacterium]
MLTDHLIISLLIILTVAWPMGALFVRLGLPVMLGQLLTGLLLGPAVLNVIHPSGAISFLADLGIFFAMFYAGMEMDPKELLEHIWPSLAVAIGGFVLPFALGFFTARVFGGTVFQSLFVGIGLSITAIAVQAVILQEMEIHKTSIGHVIMGAAIADDIISLVGFSVLLGLVQTGTIEISSILTIIVKVVLFFAFTILAGHFVIPFFTRKLDDYNAKGFTFAMISALVMASAAELAGLHTVIGAFLAGQFVRKEIMHEKIYNAISDRFYGLSHGFLMPVFFASLAFHIHFEWNLSFFVFASVITIVAILGKLLGCGLGALAFRFPMRQSALIGFGMNGRGAVELVIVAVVIGTSNDLLARGTISDPLLTQSQISALVLMAFITTLMAPLMLKWSVLKTCSGSEKEQFCQLWSDSKKR